MKRNYDILKYDSRFTFWGVACYWSDNSLIKTCRGSHKHILPEFIDMISHYHETNQPVIKVPAERNYFAHYESICLVNRDAIEEELFRLTKDKDFVNIISDNKFLNEAGNVYCTLMENNALPDQTDFVNFLLKYSHQGLQQNFSGLFSGLAKRLIYRYSECAEDYIFNSSKILERAGKIHAEALYAATTVDEEVRAFYNEIANGGRKFDEENLRKVVSLSLPCPSRHRRQQSYGDINWESFLEDRGGEMMINRNVFNINEILKARNRQLLIEKYFSKFAEDPDYVLDELKLEIESMEGAKKRAYEEVYNLFCGAFETMTNTNLPHQMVIKKTRGR